MKENTNVVNAAKKIWAIAGESPEMGNAVMDLIGDETYKKVMELQKIHPYDPNKKIYAIVIDVYDAEDDANYEPIYAIFDDLDVAINCVKYNIEDIVNTYNTEDEGVYINRIEIQSRVIGALDAYEVERIFAIDIIENVVEEYKVDLVYNGEPNTEEELNYDNFEHKRTDFSTFPIRKNV